MQTWINPAISREGWWPGPWDDEPDKAQWVDEATDLDCLIVRNRLGGLCGYVGVPVGHPLHGKDYWDLYEEDEHHIDVHGGLTYSNHCDEEAPVEGGICHVPAEGRPDNVWWLGFDCGHYMDRQPGFEATSRALYANAPELAALSVEDGTYKDIVYVQKEVTDLAEQLAKIGALR